METIQHFFAAFDIFSVLINAFPSIFSPLVHGFQSLFIMIFTSLKHIVLLYPGLISGTVFMSLVYFLVTSVKRMRKIKV